MPYKIEKRDGKECVVKEGGETKHCYSGNDAHKQALAYMRALYRAEGETKEIEPIDAELSELGMDTKEIEELTTKCGGEMGYIPWSVKSFEELDAWKQAQEIAKDVAVNTYTFGSLVQNIMGDPEWGMNEKVAAVKELADEFASRVIEPASESVEDKEKEPPVEKKGLDIDGIVETVLGKVKEFLGIHPKDASGFLVYKETDGSPRWIARYSNHFRDQDNPAEIISHQSHQRFVDRVEKGLAPLPELWIWHVKEWRIGKADWVAFDPDSGFAIAGGRSLPGMEMVFDHLSAVKNVKVSHGMPYSTIARDPKDPTVIIEHETREISPLPGWAAANKLTGFVVLDNETNKEANMAIPADKRETLKKEFGLSEEMLAKIEAANAADANKAKDEGMEHKEVEQAAATEPVPPAAETPAATAPEAEAEPEAPKEDETAKAIKELVGVVQALSVRVEAMEKKQVDGEAALQKALTETPTASILSMFAPQSAIGAKETKVDGREELAKSKPTEAKPPVEGRTLVPLINEILAGSYQGQQETPKR